jgi:hypothetical protein
MRYTDVRPTIKSGDVLVWNYKTWYSKIVSIFTTSKFNHVGIAVIMSGRVMVLEATAKGVTLLPLSEELPCYLLSLPEYWNEHIEAFAFTTIGHKYSIWQAVLGYLGFLTPGKDSQWQCAELVAVVLSSAGMINRFEMTPTLLVEELMEQGATLTYLGKQ